MGKLAICILGVALSFCVMSFTVWPLDFVSKKPVPTEVSKPASYVPVAFDYVKPALWDNFAVPYPVIANGTGYATPYDTYLKVSRLRCQVLQNPFTLNGQPQLYVNLLIVGTSNIVLWPVNYVSPFGSSIDYLVKVP